MSAVIAGPDGLMRCRWGCEFGEMLEYHDAEWGYPVDSDITMFEKLSLEGFQSGLSWRTILRKRTHIRRAFHGFDFNEIALFSEGDVERLLKDEGIVRHRGKITAIINNARLVQTLIKREGSLRSFIWRFAPGGDLPPADVPVVASPESVRLSKALKGQGWKFIGPTTVYAFMQAMGLVNGHQEGCVIRSKVERARRDFSRPR